MVNQLTSLFGHC